MMDTTTASSIVFIFIDGFGLAAAGESNPLAVIGLPRLERLLGLRLIAGACAAQTRLTVRGVDACLGVEGLPQSATGQTALFTGENGPALLGMHLPGFPNEPLREVIREKSLFKVAAGQGIRATFANAYRSSYFELVSQGKRRHSVTTVAAMAAPGPLRTTAELLRGEAVCWDITNAFLLTLSEVVPVVSPEAAGGNLMRLSQGHGLVVFETFETDLVGHRRNWESAAGLLDKLDRFLSAALQCRPPETTLVVCSDHGNFEDFATSGHTRNPVPLIAAGPAAPRFAQVQSIDGVYHAIIGALPRPTSA
jgi:hypothetical protein